MENLAMEVQKATPDLKGTEGGGATLATGTAAPPAPAGVIVVDEDPVEKRSRLSPEVIDLVTPGRSANSKCINYSCKSGEELTEAPGMCLSYYRVNSKGKTKKFVCKECFDVAFSQYELLANELQKGNLLLNVDIPLRDAVFEIDDSDEEVDHAEDDDAYKLKGANLAFVAENFDQILSTTMAKMNFHLHTEKEMDYLLTKKTSLDDSLNELQELLHSTRTRLDTVQKDLYAQFRTETVETTVVNIFDDNGCTPIINIEDRRPTPGGGLRKSVRQYRTALSTGEDRAVRAVAAPIDLPGPGPVAKPTPNNYDYYYIAKKASSGCWVKGRIKSVEKSLSGGYLYNIQELKQLKQRTVNGKNIAYSTPSKTRLEIGTRIIAAFKEITDDQTWTKMMFYPGIVAEPPADTNRYRYLIFFDIGYSQYVDYKLVYLIFECSQNVWEDLPKNSSTFIQRYLNNDERPMVKLTKDQTVRVEYSGKWLSCTVKEIDYSLALIYFDTLKRYEWIYRGSRRLSPMYKEEQNTTKHATTLLMRNKTDLNQLKSCAINRDATTIQPTFPFASPVRAVARKSTARTEGGPNVVRFLPPISNAQKTSVEPQSKIMYFTPRDQGIVKRIARYHTCSPACKDYIRHNLNKLRGHNPLSKPLLCGWARIAARHKTKQDIIYKAPCGRMLRNMKEIHQYLRLTNSDMTVDLFDFNISVRCLAEFNVDCIPNPKDLSNGLEIVPVPVINGINNERLDFCNYNTKRIPMADVVLNRDVDFLIGCDCDDDCADKTKCQCWQLTFEGAKYMSKSETDYNSLGYVYRRLYEQFTPGIYECNKRCKCKSTCLNRVVQNPMSVKLQVFRTHDRGWGIRCLNDIPQGTFICIYAGTIHTEQTANEDGINYGDEYFAELDYIEICEAFKEDYEPDVDPEMSPNRSSRSSSPDDDDDDDEDDNELNINSKRYNDKNFIPANSIKKENENSMKLRKRSKNENDDLITISDDEDEPKEVLNFNPPEEKKTRFCTVRKHFGEEEPYIMDTKNCGNIGRFLNHSCSPNIFVQNVFVDTHDLRFPWVAFFSSMYIRAGTELTWNYNYGIGSVPGRVLYCYCGAPECKGRLL